MLATPDRPADNQARQLALFFIRDVSHNMRKILTFIVFLIVSKSFACSCDTPKPAIEFYQSDYVFEGEVIEKVYSSDSLNYTLTFQIAKHYKKNDNPKFLKFQLPSEGEITGKFTSCDWNVEKGENWLVYAKNKNGKLHFQFYCSSSKPLDRFKIDASEQKILDNGQKLDLTQYRYNFIGADAITDVDSILRDYQKRKFDPSEFAFIWLDVDNNGKIETANLAPRSQRSFEVIDTIFGLNNYANEFEPPRSDFEKTAVEIARKIKEWEKYYYLDLGVPVKYRTFLRFSVDTDSIIKLEN